MIRNKAFTITSRPGAQLHELLMAEMEQAGRDHVPDSTRAQILCEKLVAPGSVKPQSERLGVLGHTRPYAAKNWRSDQAKRFVERARPEHLRAAGLAEINFKSMDKAAMAAKKPACRGTDAREARYAIDDAIIASTGLLKDVHGRFNPEQRAKLQHMIQYGADAATWLQSERPFLRSLDTLAESVRIRDQKLSQLAKMQEPSGDLHYAMAMNAQYQNVADLLLGSRFTTLRAVAGRLADGSGFQPRGAALLRKQASEVLSDEALQASWAVVYTQGFEKPTRPEAMATNLAHQLGVGHMATAWRDCLGRLSENPQDVEAQQALHRLFAAAAIISSTHPEELTRKRLLAAATMLGATPAPAYEDACRALLMLIRYASHGIVNTALLPPQRYEDVHLGHVFDPHIRDSRGTPHLSARAQLINMIGDQLPVGESSDRAIILGNPRVVGPLDAFGKPTIAIDAHFGPRYGDVRSVPYMHPAEMHEQFMALLSQDDVEEHYAPLTEANLRAHDRAQRTVKRDPVLTPSVHSDIVTGALFGERGQELLQHISTASLYQVTGEAAAAYEASRSRGDERMRGYRELDDLKDAILEM